ncbi:MAG: hypothetical protein KZQ95_08555 [Candidatus Thiodiazotropha sp. (ex Epidulcina cf. delphinae)]|nr:hypothetical protein [Candidatus Thiodiazotropha sp. (ex Epidulcina cf. delphinae)]
MRHCVENSGYDRRSIRRILFAGLLVVMGMASPLRAYAAIWGTEETVVFDLVNLQRGFNSLNALQQDDRLYAAALGHSQSMADNGFFSHNTLAGSNGATFDARVTDAGYHWTAVGENIAAGQGRVFPGPTQMSAADAARDVMYGTADFGLINAFFTDYAGVSAFDWNDLGDGLTGAHWDAWQADQGGSGGWMGSSGHRNNILSDLFDDLGVGYAWEPDDSDPILLDGGGFLNYPLHTYWTQSFAAGDSLAPVPLPGAFWLLGSGLAGLVLVSRQRRATASPVEAAG